LTPFNLAHVVEEDEVQYVKSIPAVSAPADQPVTNRAVVKEIADTQSIPKVKNAFDAMMKRAGGKLADSHPSVSKPVDANKSTPKPSKSVDDFDDDFLSNISASDLEIIENRASWRQTADSTGHTISTTIREA
jgi:senataxin